MNDCLKKGIEDLLKKQEVGDDIYCELVKQILLSDMSLN